MNDLSSLAQEIREVGENVYSDCQDLFLLLNLKDSDDVESVNRLRHGLNLVDNILSILTYLSTLDLEILDHHESLINEVNKIKFSCYGLHTALSKTIETGKPSLHLNVKSLIKLLSTVKNSGNKIITMSYFISKTKEESSGLEHFAEDSENFCYENKETCEQYCQNGFCIEDSMQGPEKADSSCPEYLETFTVSPLTHVESGYESSEKMPWHVALETQNLDYSKENKKYSIWNFLKRTFPSYVIESKTLEGGNEDSDSDYKKDDLNNNIPDETIGSDSATGNGNEINTETTESIYIEETTNELYNYNSLSEVRDDHSQATEKVGDIETTTLASYTDSTTESYGTTEYGYETTSCVYTTESYTTESPTTPAYETTTQDMYKLSQDIYQAAQDLSSKSSELSSMSSEISSKSSDISSLVSELNNYEDDELSKKIQGVSKLTQEINSKTSEISSLTSTMSSLASDISSASSDMTTADRHHAFRTTPWQKMSSKCDDLITNAQGVVTATQDILVKVNEVVSASSDLKVAATVANLAGQMTAKAQRLISEALSIVSKVIELTYTIDS